MPSTSLLEQQIKFQPTPANYGKPAALDPKVIAKLFGESYTINHMPLLCQSDPAVNLPLDNLLKDYPADKLPQKKDDKGKPLVNGQGKPIRYTLTEIRELAKGYGCYNTSIVTVISTALTNRAVNLPDLINRSKEFAQISASGNASKEINQLAWQYLQQFLNDQGEKKNGKVVQPFYFHEVVADLAGGSIQESCDPYSYGNCQTASLRNGDASAARVFNPKATELTNMRIIELMKGGSVPMIAYNRHTPKEIKVEDNGTGRPAGAGVRTFVDHGSLHKVVFNGFQSGKYPLRIYDVGNGQPYNVRLSSNLNEMKFSSKLTGSPLPFDKAFIDKPLLIYEGDDEIVDHEVFFIDHYDWLNVRSGILTRTSAF